MGCQASTNVVPANQTISSLTIGIEGGGTKTRIVIADFKASKVIYSKLYNIPSNHYLTSINQVCQDFSEIIQTSLLAAKIPNATSLGLTVAGFNTPSNFVKEHFSNYPNFVQTHDTSGPIQMFQRQFGRTPAVVIAGTGSAGFFKAQVGGLGHFLKERGCGFSAVRRAVEEACAVQDGLRTGDFGSLWSDFSAFFGFEKQTYQDSGILELFYGAGFKAKVASFNVEMKANQSDLVRKVYCEEFEYLAEMVAVLMAQGTFSDVICVGSFWGSLDSQEEAKIAFFSKFRDIKFWVVKDNGNALGAALHACDAQWKGESMFDEMK
ncbi:N-acetylglucosamine kinase [Spironucleus salmonicida]|uniref:BadF/BadG/BcrA/BcrD ATPase family protein n=1 Tax=Spironucleus salmonicida TaxID=348837 RepID=V6LQG0_9EUKA|nr:N-acetylglucosamine kinase [Spironucleus salmonicida]|eukprot:EST46483.1 BadF/BadG/BcrA/BcrD ATPase family protein [Spironucleus salmonicida]